MTVRTLPYLLVFVLGLGTAGLTACGTAKTSTALIPSANAGPLKADFDGVASAIDGHDCPGATKALGSAQAHLDSLPGSTSTRLTQAIQAGLDKLKVQAAKECVATATTTQTIPTVTTPTTTTDTTTTATTTTDTTVTDTTATDTTATLPPDTTSTPTVAPSSTTAPTGGVTTP